MGKSQHHTPRPKIRHVRYSTQNTSRGPKTIKRHVQSSHFRATNSNQTHGTDFVSERDDNGATDNNGAMDDWFQQTGKVYLL
jgi:hypothetical protein